MALTFANYVTTTQQEARLDKFHLLQYRSTYFLYSWEFWRSVKLVSEALFAKKKRGHDAIGENRVYVSTFRSMQFFWGEGFRLNVPV